jgi:D-alanyl-D-alanine carboxypeptidase
MSNIRGKKMWLWALLILLGVGAATVAGYFISQVNQRKSELADEIRMNPNTTSTVAYTFNEQGEIIEDGYELFYNADTPLVVASTMKVVILAAYANAVTLSELDPGEQVAIADLERYYLPKTDGGAHVQGLTSLGIKTGPLGFASDQAMKISLDDIARIMIHYSGNAETDYLIERLGVEKINAVPGLVHHTPIRPILGSSLALLNHENPLSDIGERQDLIRDISKGDFSYLERLMNLYLHDQDWRAAQIEFMQSGEYLNAANQIGWDGQVEASQLLPKGTAREYATLMAKIASGKLISPQVSALIRKKLESVPSDWPLRLLFYRPFGAKDGVTAGVLNLVSYAFPKQGSLAGKGRVVVILTNELPYKTWARQQQVEGNYLLQIDLARASGVFRELARSN